MKLYMEGQGKGEPTIYWVFIMCLLGPLKSSFIL